MNFLQSAIRTILYFYSIAIYLCIQWLCILSKVIEFVSKFCVANAGFSYHSKQEFYSSHHSLVENLMALFSVVSQRLSIQAVSWINHQICAIIVIKDLQERLSNIEGFCLT